MVIDGPFAETKELVSGYWIWEVRDMDEAVAWVKRCPNPMLGKSEIEIRPVFEMSDFANEMTPDVAGNPRPRAEQAGVDFGTTSWFDKLTMRSTLSTACQ